MRKINILGEEYTIENNTDLQPLGISGDTDNSTKIIRICSSFENKPQEPEEQDKQQGLKRTQRHEILHALFFESGHGFGYGNHNEDNVDYIARMYPKIKKIFQELNIED